MIKLKTHNSLKHTYVYNSFLRPTKPRSECKENHQYDDRIPHKAHKCKGIHSTVQDER